MSTVIKAVDQEVTDELLKSLVGKYVHATKNVVEVPNELLGTKDKQNAWFAGMVAGYEKVWMHYDFENETFMDEPKLYYSLIQTDGTGFILSDTELELVELSEEEFSQMVKDFQARQILLRGLK